MLPTRSPLPSNFVNLYRLSLRASSASVLHHRKARGNLRRLWRPAFDDAAQVIKRLEDLPEDSMERGHLAKWLDAWDVRMDNTLSLLLVSAKSRGLPHDLIKNLAWLVRHHRRWAGELYYHSSGNWNPSLPPDDIRYSPPSPRKFTAQVAKKERQADLNIRAWGALAEIVQLAEGRDGLCCGKMTYPAGRR